MLCRCYEPHNDDIAHTSQCTISWGSLVAHVCSSTFSGHHAVKLSAFRPR